MKTHQPVETYDSLWACCSLDTLAYTYCLLATICFSGVALGAFVGWLT